MPKFVAIRDSYGYENRYWKKGDTVEAKTLPNEHFEKVEEPKEKKAPKKGKAGADWTE